MSYLGLTCSENSSGQKQKKGSITKAGNKRVRRLLTETSWHYRHPYRATSRALKQRRKNQPQWAINIADNAGQRLRKRYRHLINNGKMPCIATIAIARELAGFIWAVFNEYQARNNKKMVWRVKTIRNRLRRGCFDLFNHPPAEARLFDFWYLKIE